MNKVRTYSDTKRLFIYLFLCFTMTFIWFAISNPEKLLWEEMGYGGQTFVALGMLFPVTAHVLTRVITKEGFQFSGKENSYFGIVLKDGKWKIFLVACLLPWIYTELAGVIELVMIPSRFDPEYYQQIGLEKRMVFLIPANAIVGSVTASFAAFGEEGGWRGYMMPKLMKIMGRNKALLTGGIIWGLWHAPLTCIGHNFGTDYPGFPYVGILKMCIFCTLMGVILTYLTEKSGSVWPATFMHAIVNASPSILKAYINPDKGESSLILGGWSGMIISMLIFAVIVLVLWSKKRDPEENGRNIAG